MKYISLITEQLHNTLEKNVNHITERVLPILEIYYFLTSKIDLIL